MPPDRASSVDPQSGQGRRSECFCFGARGRLQSCRWRYACSRSWRSMLLIMKRALCTWVLLPLVETDATSAASDVCEVAHTQSPAVGDPRLIRRRSAPPLRGIGDRIAATIRARQCVSRCCPQLPSRRKEVEDGQETQ